MFNVDYTFRGKQINLDFKSFVSLGVFHYIFQEIRNVNILEPNWFDWIN